LSPLGDPTNNERVLKTQANVPWNFAFVMSDGDFVICPSSASGYLLVGKIIGEYSSDFDNWTSVAKSKTRADLIHLRKVKWICALSEKDPRYEKLHRIGQLTVVRPSLTATDLLDVISERYGCFSRMETRNHSNGALPKSQTSRVNREKHGSVYQGSGTRQSPTGRKLERQWSCRSGK
jgi:hypothetical protein